MNKGKHISIRIDNETHYKLSYISKYEGRSANGQIKYLLNKCIKEFEDRNGKIDFNPENDNLN